MTESQLLRACLDILTAKRIFAWRANSGAVRATYKGKDRFIRFNGARGCSDILGVLPNGRFLAIETKVGKNQPTADQAAFLRRVAECGGLALVVYTPDQLIDELAAEKWS